MISKQTNAEVYNIICLMSPELKSKIPQNVVNNIKNNMNDFYQVKINDLKDYKPSLEAKKVLAVLYKKYFASDEEKMIIKAKEKSLKNTK